MDYHGLQCLSNASLLFRHNVSQNPEAGIQEGDQEEDGVEHSDHVEKLAFALRASGLAVLRKPTWGTDRSSWSAACSLAPG